MKFFYKLLFHKKFYVVFTATLWENPKLYVKYSLDLGENFVKRKCGLPCHIFCEIWTHIWAQGFAGLISWWIHQKRKIHLFDPLQISKQNVGSCAEHTIFCLLYQSIISVLCRVIIHVQDNTHLSKLLAGTSLRLFWSRWFTVAGCEVDTFQSHPQAWKGDR